MTKPLVTEVGEVFLLHTDDKGKEVVSYSPKTVIEVIPRRPSATFP